jgi:hypothetical protein
LSNVIAIDPATGVSIPIMLLEKEKKREHKRTICLTKHPMTELFRAKGA